MATLKCCDCGEPGMELSGFIVPDKVWDALLPLEAHACLSCFAKRLNPADPPDAEHLEEEIWRQRKRFRLKNVNKWLGSKEVGERLKGRYIAYFNVTAEARESLGTLTEEELKWGQSSQRVRLLKK